MNEQLEDLNQAFALATQDIEIVCECAQLDCMARITMAGADYERVRADPTLFAVVDGHQIADVESVEEKHAEWVIVRKKPGVPAELARELNPRGD